MPDDLKSKISAQIAIQPNECWEWRGSIDKDGYGRLTANGKQVATHRLSYVAYRGEIPGGFQIDHLCRNRRCCNPFHLEAVTARENTLRGTSFSAVNARKTHCVHGHPFSEANTYRQGGMRRQCRMCNLNSVRRYKTRRNNDVASVGIARAA